MGPLVLDISRSISRSGRANPTGIDRVETAYFRHFLNSGMDCRFLARVPGGEFALTRNDAGTVLQMLENGRSDGRLDLRAKLSVSRNTRLRQMESLVRQLGKKDVAVLPGDTYFNVGHSNLSLAMVAARRGAGGKSVVMLHDVIPLDHPEYSSKAASTGFAGKFAAFAGADIGLCNSEFTRSRAQVWAGKYGLAPALAVVKLGTGPGSFAARKPVRPARFLALGTIEPRKNHALLLDVWRHFHETMPVGEIPHLDIVGNRGWRNESLFARLESEPFMGVTVHECGALPDADVRRMIARATALLFPSFAEGFGLPVVEALQAGLPVCCSDLAVLREIAGDAPLYLPPDAPHIWAKAIMKSAEQERRVDRGFKATSWDDHFAAVFELVTRHGLGRRLQ